MPNRRNSKAALLAALLLTSMVFLPPAAGEDQQTVDLAARKLIEDIQWETDPAKRGEKLKEFVGSLSQQDQKSMKELEQSFQQLNAEAQAKEKKPDEKDQLCVAASDGDKGVVQELLGKGVSPNAKDSFGRTPLLYAAEKGNLEVLQVLLDAGSDPNAPGEKGGLTPLAAALANGYTEAADLLRKEGAR